MRCIFNAAEDAIDLPLLALFEAAAAAAAKREAEKEAGGGGGGGANVEDVADSPAPG